MKKVPYRSLLNASDIQEALQSIASLAAQASDVQSVPKSIPEKSALATTKTQDTLQALQQLASQFPDSKIESSLLPQKSNLAAAKVQDNLQAIQNFASQSPDFSSTHNLVPEKSPLAALDVQNNLQTVQGLANQSPDPHMVKNAVPEKSDLADQKVQGNLESLQSLASQLPDFSSASQSLPEKSNLAATNVQRNLETIQNVALQSPDFSSAQKFIPEKSNLAAQKVQGNLEAIQNFASQSPDFLSTHNLVPEKSPLAVLDVQNNLQTVQGLANQSPDPHMVKNAVPEKSDLADQKVQGNLESLQSLASQLPDFSSASQSLPEKSNLAAASVQRNLETIQNVALQSPDFSSAQKFIPEKSTLASLNVQNNLQVLQDLANRSPDVQIVQRGVPEKSNLGDIKVQNNLQAIQELANQSATPQVVQNAVPEKSNLADVRLQQNLQNIQSLANQPASIQPAAREIPNASVLSDRRVQQNLQNMQQLASQAPSPQVVSKSQAALERSGFTDERFQQNLQALQQMASQSPNPQVVQKSIPNGSTFASEQVRSALQQIQEESKKPISALFLARNVLNGGELSPHMMARYDQPRYETGCEKLLNMVPLPQGGITKRPGLVYFGDSEKGSRFIPFIFSANEARMLEMKPSGKMIVWFRDGTNVDSGLTLPVTQNLDQLSYAQSADVVYFAHPDYEPFKLMRYADNNWKYEVYRPGTTFSISTDTCFSKWPFYTNKDGPGAPKGLESDGTINKYCITAVSVENGKESYPVHFESTPYHEPSSTMWIEFYMKADPKVLEYRLYRRKNGVYGFIGTAKGGETFYDKGISPDTTDTPPSFSNPFTAKGERPSLVFFYQQRLGFASSNKKPLTIWMSEAGNFDTIGTAHQPPKDDDPIEATLASNQANRILWAMPDRNVLAIGTEGGEWTLSGGAEGGAITPSNLSFQAQSYHGSTSYVHASVRALQVGDGLIYLQRGGRIVREFSYSFQSDRYQSNDLSILARHILRQYPIVSWTWQDEPHSIIWAVVHDGTLVGITYMKEHDVVAWHCHTTLGGKFIDVESIPGAFGNKQVWFHVERNEKLFVEVLDDFSERPYATGYNHKDGKDKKTFAARCIPAMPDMTMQNGSTIMRVRKINAIKCRVMNSNPFQVRIGNSDPMDVPVRGSNFVTLDDWNCPIAGGWRENEKVELIFDGSDPVTVLAVLTTVELADMAGSVK